jgi:signal transduction histidine kinase
MLVEGATTDLRQENERLRAQLHARTEELRRSRARLVATADEQRRRLERDLHDGAQSRFVATALHLRAVQAKAPPDGEIAAGLRVALDDLMTGIQELRELARGIHPAVLTERGLEAAVDSLATRAPLPVEVRSSLHGRLPAPVETAAYFAVSEALANVAKHAGPAQVVVDLWHERGRLVAEIADDGRGGASMASGSGLRGLADRIGALDGSVEIDSAPGAGTRVHVEIPCRAAVPAEVAELCRELAVFHARRFSRAA